MDVGRDDRESDQRSRAFFANFISRSCNDSDGGFTAIDGTGLGIVSSARVADDLRRCDPDIEAGKADIVEPPPAQPDFRSWPLFLSLRLSPIDGSCATEGKLED
jgi:hypothetical protein